MHKFLTQTVHRKEGKYELQALFRDSAVNNSVNCYTNHFPV